MAKQPKTATISGVSYTTTTRQIELAEKAIEHLFNLALKYADQIAEKGPMTSEELMVNIITNQAKNLGSAIYSANPPEDFDRWATHLINACKTDKIPEHAEAVINGKLN